VETAAYPGTGDPAKMRGCGEIGPDEVSVWSGGGEGETATSELTATEAQLRTALSEGRTLAERLQMVGHV
jgi:hypothetical protein